MRTRLAICLSVLSFVGLSACASSGNGYRDNSYADRYGRPTTSCEQDRSTNRAVGTVVGAGIGALAGSAIAGNSSNTAGTIAGGVAGAVIGNQVAKGGPCPSDYRR